MSAAVKLATTPQQAAQKRITAPCPFCTEFLSIPARYNVVDFCPKAKRMAVNLPQQRPRFTLIDGHRVTQLPPKLVQQRPRSGFFARVRAALSSARAAWKATR